MDRNTFSLKECRLVSYSRDSRHYCYPVHIPFTGLVHPYPSCSEHWLLKIHSCTIVRGYLGTETPHPSCHLIHTPWLAVNIKAWLLCFKADQFCHVLHVPELPWAQSEAVLQLNYICVQFLPLTYAALLTSKQVSSENALPDEHSLSQALSPASLSQTLLLGNPT